MTKRCFSHGSHEKRMKGIFDYVLQFMLTLVKMQQYFNVKKIKIWRNLQVIQAFHTVSIVVYNGCSDPDIRSLTATY